MIWRRPKLFFFAEISHGDLLLIDERIGRKVAEARGITVRGTLGVLVQARQLGTLPALRPVLEALISEGFRMAPALVREALDRVGEPAKVEKQDSTQRS